MKPIQVILQVTYLTLVFPSMVKFPVCFPIYAISWDAVLEWESYQSQPLAGNMHDMSTVSHIYVGILFCTLFVRCLAIVMTFMVRINTTTTLKVQTFSLDFLVSIALPKAKYDNGQVP